MGNTKFNAVDAAFYFFSAIGKRPGGATWILVWQVLIYGALGALVLLLMAPFLAAVIDAARHGEDEEALLRGMVAFISGYLLAIMGPALVALILQGAWLRFLARDEIAAVTPLRFGLDELRLLIVNAGLLALLSFASVTFLFVLVTVNGLIANFVQSGAGIAISVGLITFIAIIAFSLAWLFVALRLAAAPALTVLNRQIVVYRSFNATSGRWGGMLLAYVIIIALFFVVFSVIGLIANVVLFVSLADIIPALSALEEVDDPHVVLTTLSELVLRPSALIGVLGAIILMLVVQILFEGSMHGVGAYVARLSVDDLNTDEAPSPTPVEAVGQAPSEG